MANKRVIDLPDLSQEVQEGQYVLVDSVGGTGKMDLKHIVDEAGSFDPAGEYPELFAGNLTTDKAQEDKTPYLFRKTGGTLSRIGERCYDTIIGASVGENQLVQSGDTSVTVPNGHKYYSKINGTETLGASTGSAIAINDSSKDMVTDLTAELGTSIADYIYQLETATAGAGIAKLREWGFLRGYQAYNAGSLESVEVTGKKVVGFNAWDEEVESGNINENTGENVVLNSYTRSKNYIKIVESASYYFKKPASVTTYLFFYDSDKNFIIRTDPFATSGEGGTFAIPNGSRYMRFSTYKATYNHDICINLSNPDRNGEYEAYTSQTYALGSDTLRGIFKLDANNNLYADGDRKTSDGTITRKYGIVDLGTLNYTYSNGLFRAGVLYKGSGNNSIASNLVCAKYVNIAWNDSADKSIKLAGDGDLLAIADSAYTDAAAFKTAMSGVMLVCEKQTPTTEQSTPFTSPQVCYPDGTEEFITENGVPVGHETEYPYDLKGLVEELIDVPDVPSANGTYVLKATRSASGVAYNWVTG